MMRVLFFALIIAYVNADAGGSNPAFTQVGTFTATVVGGSRSDVETAMNTVLGDTLTYTGSGNTYDATTSTEVFTSDLAMPGPTFCDDLVAEMSSSYNTSVIATNCVTNEVTTTTQTDSVLDDVCVSGDDGLSVGEQVFMDYDGTSVSVGDDGSTVLTTIFQVPTQYFFTEQNISDTTYERSFAVTWHARNETDSTNELQGSCFTTRSNYDHCMSVAAPWSNEDFPASSGCTQVVTGELSFFDLVNGGEHDPEMIRVETESFDLYNTEDTANNQWNHTTEQWAIYLIAVVETWNGFEQIGENNGIGNIDTNNPNVDDNLDFDNHLTLTAERYSQYMIPFKITFPKEITLDYLETLSVGRLVVLRAIIDQQTVNIDFTPDDDMFGEMELVLVTQTQYPFGLLDYNDTDAPATIIRSPDSDFYHNAKSVEFTSVTNMSECITTAPNEMDYCVQTWTINIKPKECSVNGHYEMEFYARCYMPDAPCALDDLIYTPSEMQNSNSWSGVLGITIETQDFCPSVIDEISVQADIFKFADNGFMEEAIPGTNLFSNDFVYVETRLWAASSQSQLDIFATPDPEGDDTLIDFVRPYKITLDVVMTSPPVQYDLVLDISHGDVEITKQDADSIEYTITLCEVDPLNFPYNTTSDPLCFDSENIGYYATTFLDFEEIVSTSTNNTIDANEIGFQMRLDERAIPVDVPNHPVTVTLSEWIEVFYHDDTHPDNSRRALRRALQTVGQQRQSLASADTFSLIKKNDLDYCALNPSLQYTGFKLDTIMNNLDMPTPNSVSDDVLEMRYDIAQFLDIDWSLVQIYRVDRCADGNCYTMFNNGASSRRALQEDSEYVSYFIEIRDPAAAQKLQLDLVENRNNIYTLGPFYGKPVQAIAADHCNTELQQQFNSWRSQNSVTDIQDNLDDGVSAWAVTLLVALLAVLY